MSFDDIDRMEAVREYLNQTECLFTACMDCTRNDMHGPFDAVRRILDLCDFGDPHSGGLGYVGVAEIRAAIAKLLDATEGRPDNA
jgi:hypothetical protein